MPNRSQYVAEAAFYGVFPFFFFYHALVAFGIIPLFLGSWWSASLGIALLALLPLATPLAWRTWRIHAPAAALAAIASVYALYYSFEGFDYQRSTIYFMYTAKLVVGWSALYCLGLLLKPSDRLASVSFWLTIAMIAITPLLIQTGIYTDEAKVSGEITGLSNYQYFSMTVAFTALIAVGSNWRNGRDAILVGAAPSATYFLLARSDLVGCSMVFAGWIFLAVMNGRWKSIVMSLVSLVAVYFYVIAALSLTPLVTSTLSSVGHGKVECCDNSGGGQPATTTPNPSQPAPEPSPEHNVAAQTAERQSEALNLDTSPSWNYRAEYFAKGWEAIKRSPIFGDYGGQIRDFDNPGAYIHNMLDAWRQYGIVAFVIYAGLCIGGALFVLWHVVYLKKMDRTWVLTAIIAGYVCLLSLAVKSVFWPLPAMAWGMVAARVAERQLTSQNRTFRHLTAR